MPARCVRRSDSVRNPEGGLALWVEFGAHIEVDALAAHAADKKLFIRSGRQFSPRDSAVNALRLGFASMHPDELVIAVRRLREAARLTSKARKNISTIDLLND